MDSQKVENAAGRGKAYLLAADSANDAIPLRAVCTIRGPFSLTEQVARRPSLPAVLYALP
jgi:hypothetical protein